MSLISKLPVGWRMGPLSSYCPVASGSTPKTGVPGYWNGDIPWLTPDDLSRHQGKYIDGGRRRLSQAGFDSCSTRLVPAGSVLYSSRAPIGYAAIASRPLCTNQGFKSALPTADFMPDFLYWQLIALTPSIRSAASGTTFKEISGKAFGAVQVVVPPLDEQQRIVAVLEDHLSRLDAGLKSLHAARTRALALLHKADLDLICGAAPRRPISDLLTLSVGGLWGGTPGTSERDVTVARVTELRPLGRLDLTVAARRSVTERQLSGRRLRVGDLLLEKSGGGPRSPVGRVGLVQWEPDHATICSNFMQLLRPDSAQVRPEYLHLALNALHATGGTAHLQKASTNIRNIKASAFVQLLIPCPAPQEQDAAVERHLTLQARVERLQCDIRSLSSLAAGLRRSLLTAAFSGRL